MALEVGTIVDGKVSGITKFGAFVDLPDGSTGMVHISEVSNTYVSEISEYVKEGQEVKVKIVSLGENGKISLSMKQAESRPKQNNRERRPYQQRRAPRQPAPVVTSPGDFEWKSGKKDAFTFEDMMSKFKQTSEDKMSDLKRGGESRGYSRRGNGGGKK